MYKTVTALLMLFSLFSLFPDKYINGESVVINEDLQVRVIEEEHHFAEVDLSYEAQKLLVTYKGTNYSYIITKTDRSWLRVNYRALQQIDRISYEDKNGDGIEEIVIAGSYSEGVFDTDMFITFKGELWYNLHQEEIVEIMDKKTQGHFRGSIAFGATNYEYNYLKNKKSFIEKIECTIRDEHKEREGSPIYVTRQSYLWKKDRYILKEYYRARVDNLRIRASNALDGKIITHLKKDEKVEKIDYAPGGPVEVNGIEGQWMRVKTATGKVGWCFDAYLETSF